MNVKILEDQTVVIVDRDDSLTGILAGGLDSQANDLNLSELMAVQLAVKMNPFPLGDGERFYRHCLKVILANPDKMPNVTLGQMRRFRVLAAMGGCNAPNDAYLRIASDIARNVPVTSY